MLRYFDNKNVEITIIILKYTFSWLCLLQKFIFTFVFYSYNMFIY